MTAVAQVPPELGSYLDELVERLSAVADLDAVYLFGSAAGGAYEHGRSDVDVIAVTARPLSAGEKRALADAAEALPCPARKLELVVYPRGAETWEINLNTGEHVSFDPAEEPPFWFVLDRAVAERHVIALLGPPWEEVFAPVTRDEILDALADALAWQEREDPLGRSSVLNTIRSWMWLETGEWASKPEAAQWLRERVRARIAQERA